MKSSSKMSLTLRRDPSALPADVFSGVRGPRRIQGFRLLVKQELPSAQTVKVSEAELEGAAKNQRHPESAEWMGPSFHCLKDSWPLELQEL